MVLGVCQRALRHSHDAEDACQATFLVLARKAAAIRHGESLGSWLYGVAFRIARKLRAGVRTRSAGDMAAVSTRRPGEAEPNRDVTWREALVVLDEELNRLPRSYRDVLVACYLEGRPQDEAARLLGISAGSLRGRLMRARERLRARLVRRGISMPAVLLGVAVASTEASAALPPSLGIATIAATAALRAGQPPGQVLAPKVLTLMEGVLKEMFLTKLNKVLAMIMTLGLVTAAATVLYGGGPGDAQRSIGPFAKLAVANAAQEPVAAPAGKQADEEDDPADLMQSVTNLKELALAMHNYHDNHGTFPPAALHKDGKPLLSWRVLILPYLEQKDLYDQFKLDEPWDSAHNKKLLEKMPKIFDLGKVKTKPHTTFYQVFAGEGAAFEGADGLQIQDITDGTSNTILIAEAGEAVPWTKPADLAFEAKKKLPKLGGMFKDRFHVAFADGSVRTIPSNFNTAVMEALITRAGGEVVNLDDLNNP